MAHAREPRHEPADGLVRPRRAAGRGGDDDEGPVPVGHARTVTLYTSEGCALCERAHEVLLEVRRQVAFELEVVDVRGDPDLERRYRERLPVVEIDGEQAFTYFVDESALRARLG